MSSGKLVARGAEAELYRGRWHGREVIAKRRIPKTYRESALDDRLRVARTKSEARLMAEARRTGVPTPLIYDVDLQQCEIVMEFLDGALVRDLLGRLTPQKLRELCVLIGCVIGRLHANDIIHGDLTTSNMIWHQGRLYLIDFGLGERNEEVEVKGVDLRVLAEGLGSTHPQLSCYDPIMAAYVKEYPKGEAIQRKVVEIGQRGRYR